MLKNAISRPNISSELQVPTSRPQPPAARPTPARPPALPKSCCASWPRASGPAWGQATKTACTTTFRQGCHRQAQGTTRLTTCSFFFQGAYAPVMWRVWAGGAEAPQGTQN